MPPWRFQFPLDRARYFAEHAKSGLVGQGSEIGDAVLSLEYEA